MLFRSSRLARRTYNKRMQRARDPETCSVSAASAHAGRALKLTGRQLRALVMQAYPSYYYSNPHVVIDPRLILSHHVLPGQYLFQAGTVGGGSLAWLDDQRRLNVGPRSAGSTRRS